MIYARTTRDFGTNADIVILSDHPNEHMMAVPSAVASLLRQLISKGAKGIKLATMHGRDHGVLSDIEKLGIRLSRSRHAGHVTLINTVQIVDQRNIAEAA